MSELDFERRYGNERDLEEHFLLEFLEQRRPQSLLDVGAHYSWFYYAGRVRKLVPHYEAVDLVDCAETAAIVDRYHVGNLLELELGVGNLLELELGGFEVVVSVSAIEHAGISTYVLQDWRGERQRVFKRIVELAERAAFLTFPFGRPMWLRGEYANVTADDLSWWRASTPRTVAFRPRFFFRAGPTARFREIGEAEAARVDYEPSIGLRCVCVLTVEK